VALAEPLKAVAATLVADAITVLTPFAAPAAEVTFNVADPLAPGASVRVGMVKTADHPTGTVAARLKLPELHAVPSLLVTDTV
jgi:hypothetical protein